MKKYLKEFLGEIKMKDFQFYNKDRKISEVNNFLNYVKKIMPSN